MTNITPKTTPKTTPHRTPFHPLAPIPLLTLLLLTLLLTSCTKEPPAADTSDKVAVGVLTPQIGDIIITGEYIGVIQPVQQVAILPPFPAEVVSVYFNVGDTVKAGDVLFTIDTADIETSITSLEAQLATQDVIVQSAQTALSLLDGSAFQSQILSAAGGVVQAEAGVMQAEHNLEQALLGIEQAQMGYDMAAQSFADTTMLFEADVVPRSAYEQAEAAYSNAKSGLERANIAHSMAEIALTQAKQGHAQALEGQRILLEESPAENRRRAEDGLAQAQAARNVTILTIENTRDKLNDANVTTPIDGVVERRNVEPFGVASPQAPAFLISAQDSMTVSFKVPRSSLEHMQIGDSISLRDGFTTLAGRITEIGTMVDHGGLITVLASVPSPPASLLSGTTVKVLAEARKAENTIVLPLNTIHHENGEPHVYVATDGIARLVPVEAGIFDANYIQIISGIELNAQIINTWSTRLADGAEIELELENEV
ncbi:MAG: HlyD family secretion protein [Defluviitaleaceae bacterium]|nr:HlyD family secretion protein [Defluviitaleaceae bacterium]